MIYGNQEERRKLKRGIPPLAAVGGHQNRITGQSSAGEKGRHPRRGLCLFLLLFSLAVMLFGCGRQENSGAGAGRGTEASGREHASPAVDESADGSLNVYNAGEYIDPEVIGEFEEETGIRVVYDSFETNEEMYPVIQAGGVIYDAVCPSDYMIEKMIENHLLQPLDKTNLQNLSEIDPEYMSLAAQFDPENRYAVPYMTGTVGIIYNRQMLDELGIPYPTKWADLWNPALKGEILMQNSVRDSFMVALKKEGYSQNSTNEQELDQAMKDLIAQKALVQAYGIDQVRDKMIGGEAAVGVIYSGEMLYIQGEVEGSGMDLEYVIPEEGTNAWVDAWVIPYNAKHKKNAEKWIDFLCRPDIALKNFEYITYTTPNRGAYELLDPKYKENPSLFPDMKKLLQKSEVYHYLGSGDDQKYNNRWKIIKAS